MDNLTIVLPSTAYLLILLRLYIDIGWYEASRRSVFIPYVVFFNNLMRISSDWLVNDVLKWYKWIRYGLDGITTWHLM